MSGQQPEATDELPTKEAESRASQQELFRELAVRLDDLIKRVRTLAPDYEPPPLSLRRLAAHFERSLSDLPKELQSGILARLRKAVDEDWFNPETLKGMWYMANYTAKYNVDLAKRRYTGEYETDEWGLDWEFLDAARPFFAFLYKVYWRAEITGIEHIPVDGRALLVANHSGQVPWDAAMVAAAVLTDHPAQRLVRTLYTDWFPTVPFLSHMLVKLGQAVGTVDNGRRLLEQDELVAVYPEGQEGVSKPFRERYRLARFGRGEFVQMAFSSGAPIIPVSVVGAEEMYISLSKSSSMARMAGLPYFPISPTFPWLGLLGLVPLPTKWYIDFGQPIPVDGYGPEAANNLVLMSQFSDQLRSTVQEMICERLAQRRSVFFG
jgi:1-acyl-sn-glycerol-3-phosphate acyltransferase